MKRQLCLLAIISGSLISGLLLHQASAQNRRRKPGTIREEGVYAVAVAEAPPQCTQLVRDFIAYVSHEKPDIASDRQAQNRWLSDSLQKALVHRLTVYKEYD